MISRRFFHTPQLNAELDALADAINAATGGSVTNVVNIGTGGGTSGGGGTVNPADWPRAKVANTSGLVLLAGFLYGFTASGVVALAQQNVVRCAFVGAGLTGDVIAIGPAEFHAESSTLVWKVGDPLWVSATVLGTVTNVRPHSPKAQLVGQVWGAPNSTTGLVPGLFNPLLQTQ
jgi:hypothetical protein